MRPCVQQIALLGRVNDRAARDAIDYRAMAASVCAVSRRAGDSTFRRHEPMTPLTWYERAWDRFCWTLFWRWAQCCAELPFKDCTGCSYCIRPRWHPGKHRTSNGEAFDIHSSEGK